MASVLQQARYSVGVIAGNLSVSQLFSVLIPWRDDGAVSVAATAMKGMTDHITLSATHSFLMNNPLVLYQVLWFLPDLKARGLFWLKYRRLLRLLPWLIHDAMSWAGIKGGYPCLPPCWRRVAVSRYQGAIYSLMSLAVSR